MDLYAAIAERYDDIFPLDPGLASFALSRMPAGPPRRMLDCGCATGSLDLALAAAGVPVCGIDLDPGLVDQARAKARAAGVDPAPEFRVMDMTLAEGAFPPATFSLVACLGNTLPHLKGPAQMLRCLRGFRALLAPGGLLLIQIIDFKRIVERRLPGLPAIENRRIRFEREYRGIGPGTPFEFAARLWVKPGAEPASGSATLYPLYRAELDDLLSQAGFAQREYPAPEGGGSDPAAFLAAACR